MKIGDKKITEFLDTGSVQALYRALSSLGDARAEPSNKPTDQYVNESPLKIAQNTTRLVPTILDRRSVVALLRTIGGGQIPDKKIEATLYCINNLPPDKAGELLAFIVRESYSTDPKAPRYHDGE